MRVSAAPALICGMTVRRFTLAASVIALAILAARCSSSPDMVPIYLGTYTDGASRGIYRLTLDPGKARLSEPVLVAQATNPSFLAWHPTQPVLYAVSETDTVGAAKSGAVLAFRIDGSGGLAQINQEPSGGGGACYVSVNEAGTYAFVANYGGGTVAAFPVRGDGGVKPAASVVQHTGTGPHATRQTRAHAHAIRPMPGGPFVLAADLGADQLFVYRLEESTGALQPHQPPSVAASPGAGPRHFAPHASNDALFLMNELSSTVTSYAWDPAAGTLHKRGEVSTLSDGFTGENTTAEVAVHPNGRFVYGSNRGNDSIAAFRVAADRTLTRVGVYPTGGRTPRHFAIDPTGAFLIAANQESDTVVLFRIDEQTGALEDTGARARVPSPVYVGMRPER
jgi:6-phosphogluconolactonase